MKKKTTKKTTKKKTTMNKKEENIVNKNYNKLPDMCWGVLATDNTIVIIKKGQSGYYKTDYPAAKSREAAEEWCDELNERLGVAKNVRRAMEHGSMFGWDTPGADPEDKINFLTYVKTTKDERRN